MNGNSVRDNDEKSAKNGGSKRSKMSPSDESPTTTTTSPNGFDLKIRSDLGRVSPSKRGIINLGNRLSPVKLQSPQKTPNGRAGLPSPKKRSIDELNKSARKRAFNTVNSKYRRLMEDYDEGENEEYLDRQDVSIAERIIQESRRDGEVEDDFRAYGSDVEFEEDLTEMPKGRRRRKETRRKIEMEPVDASESEGIEGFDDLEDESNDEEYEIPKKRTQKTSRRKLGKQKLLNELWQGQESAEENLRDSTPRKKVGRPSKADKVVGKIKSIFQMDDEVFFKDNKVKKDTLYATKTPSEDSETDLFLTMNLNSITETTISSAPKISGVKSQAEGKNPYDNGYELGQRFKPLVMPKVDDDGNIVDPEFTKKYLPNLDNSGDFGFRLVDDRAFFLEGTEGYFEQHMGRPKTSASTLSQMAPPLEYNEFIPFSKLARKIRSHERKQLAELHKSLYNQWCFELLNGYNLNFFGFGSKVRLILDFVQNYLIEWLEIQLRERGDFPEILVVNGYNPAVKFKKIVMDIFSVFLPEEKRKQDRVKFPKHISESVPFLINYIERQRSPNHDKKCPRLVLVIHNIDGDEFRDERIQKLLSELCALPEIWLISSTDNINVSLLWDLAKLKNFNFLWHDLTTYEPYDIELSFKDILSMGKSKKFVGNKGAKYVLSSLTYNARNLYKILLRKQIEVMKSTMGPKGNFAGVRGSMKLAIEFRSFYNACLEEFVTSNEINFRTMLGEFVEHKMCNLAKDNSGSEMVFVPFSYDEIEKLLEEEFGSH